ncbi:MAG TPA: acyl-CoA dehydrogenase, partial [Phenylobacterium sp.]
MADFGGTELEGFRAETRAWLEENFPASLRKNPEAITAVEQGAAEADGDVALWKQRMGEKGWGVPTWPRAYGGGGLSRDE